jgi:cytochrome c oxidase assembly factor 2
MPPHLHPRSSATTTLFASTLAASFIIVGIPHIFPCPAPRKGYLDAEGNVVRKRRRRSKDSDGVDVADETQVAGRGTDFGAQDAQSGLGGELKSLLGSAKVGVDSSPLRRETRKGGGGGSEGEDVRALFREMKEEAAVLESERRECPVPKPRGKIGEMLGFGRDGKVRRGEDGR